MKVFILATDVFFKGGIQRYTRYQYKALIDILGKENIFLYSFKQKDAFSFEENIDVYFVEPYKGIIGKLNFLYKILVDVKNLKPDLIIVNHVNLSPVGYIIKKLFGISYFTNVYGLEIWSGLNRIKIKSLLQSDKIIGDCMFILNYINRNLGVKKEKMELLYDPVDINRFKPDEKKDYLYYKYNIPKGKFIILTVGRLDRFKGHSLVIDAMQFLPNDIIYLIVGGGVLEKALKEKVNKLGLEDKVIFTGRVPEDEIVDFYNICDIFILISKFDKNEGEGLPLTPIEAAACGKPIIVGNEDGSKEAVINGFNGFAINPDDIQTLIEKILLLYKDRELLTKMGANSRTFVTENFNFDIFKQKLENIVCDVGIL